MDYAVVVGLFGISVAFFWRVVFVLTRGIEKSLEEFKALTNERFDRQDAAIKEGFARQDERFAMQDERFAMQDERFAMQDKRFDSLERRLDKQDEHRERQGALMLRLVRDVGLLTGALIGIPSREREKVGSPE